MHTMKGRNYYGTQLDPELWQGLPEDILDRVMARVMAKLPFSGVIALRRVCKRWYSEASRVAVALEASSRAALLYFSYHNNVAHGSPWWLQVCKAKGECSGSVEEFQSKLFPTPRSGEYVRLLICERGLLFFGFTRWGSEVTRDIVVCNPLISKSKSLRLPCSLRGVWFGRAGHRDLVVGVTFDSETGCYCFVCAGEDEKGQHVTFLYHSQSSKWTKGSSLSSVRTRNEWLVLSQRSFGCSGNLYWYAKTSSLKVGREDDVLKFDSKHGKWISNLFHKCEDCVPRTFHGVTYNGENFIWHLHRAPILSKHIIPARLWSYEEFSSPGRLMPPQFMDWPCRFDRRGLGERELGELAPEIKLMPHYMMEKIYRFLSKVRWMSENNSSCRYMAFNQRNCIYHVASGPDLAVLVHDANESSWTELPSVPNWRFPANHRCCAENVWCFSPSLTSLP